MSLRFIAERATIDVANGKPEEIATVKEMLKAYVLRFADAMHTCETDPDKCAEQPEKFQLELDGECFKAAKASELKGLEQFLMKLPATDHAVWNAQYNYDGNRELFGEPEEGSFEKEAYAARHIGIYDTERFTDDDDKVMEAVEICHCIEYGYGEWNLYFSSVGSKAYLSGDKVFAEGLETVKAVRVWDGGLLGLYADLDASIGDDKVAQLNKAFRTFDETYESDEYLELQDEKNGRLHGMCYGNYCIKAEKVQEFFTDVEKLRALVTEADPEGRVKLEGYLTANDIAHRFGLIRVQTAENGEFVLSSTKFC